MTEQIKELLENKKLRELKKVLGGMDPADIALEIEDADEAEQIVIFRLLSKDIASQTFVEFEADTQENLLKAFSDKEIKAVLDDLFVDDTVDIIEEMPANVVRRILAQTDKTTREQINQILRYPEHSAGSVMTTEYIRLREDMTVGQAREVIRRQGDNMETVYDLYVTDSDRHLLGVVTAREILLSKDDVPITDIKEENIISAFTLDDQEEVAGKLAKYDLLALPVVDSENRLVGIVTVDDAIDVIQEEATEDIEKMAAIIPTDKPYLRTGVLETWRKRIPWLMLLMISATFTGMIISGFENRLATCVVLTAFIPMLMDTGGNSGSQAAVTVIRSLSLGDIELGDIMKVIWKELRVALLCGVSLAVVNFGKLMLVDRLLLGNEAVTLTVATVVCLTLSVAVLIAKLVGCSLPILAKALKFDPAVMASPFITTIVDALSLLVYFRFASAMLPL